MVNNSTNIKKANNYIRPLLIEHKKTTKYDSVLSLEIKLILQHLLCLL